MCIRDRGYTWETTLTSQVSGYIRFLDTRRLVAVAKSHHVKVDVLRRVGHFVPAGVPLMKLSRGDRMQLDGSEELRGAFDFGPTRTLQQDVEFGVLQIVDIALKAISPAVNDPTTAIGSVDQLSRILIRFASRETPESTLYDPPGVFRVHVPWIGFERLLDSAFEQIRLYARSDVAVSLRLLRALADIAVTTPDPLSVSYTHLDVYKRQVQTLPQGPAASQEAIKMLGTNGGGFFNANSAHPFENPTPFSNFLQILSIFIIPAGLTYTLGRMTGSPGHGWAVLAAMFVLFAAGFSVIYWAESQPHPLIHGAQQTHTATAPGGNMEGKEVRNGCLLYTSRCV